MQVRGSQNEADPFKGGLWQTSDLTRVVHLHQTLHVRTCRIPSIDRQRGERHRPQAELIVGETAGWRRQDTGILGRIQRWHWDGADHS